MTKVVDIMHIIVVIVETRQSLQSSDKPERRPNYTASIRYHEVERR